jgi:methyl-accepting chemotaxis protein
MATRTKKSGSAKEKKSSTLKKRLYAAAEHMEESRATFATETLRVMDGLVAFNEDLRSFERFVDNRDDEIASRLRFTDTAMDSIERLVDVVRESTVALHENTDRLNESINKMERYFGADAVLEAEN